jgi:hypothetical protein
MLYAYILHLLNIRAYLSKGGGGVSTGDSDGYRQKGAVGPGRKIPLDRARSIGCFTSAHSPNATFDGSEAGQYFIGN